MAGWWWTESTDSSFNVAGIGNRVQVGEGVGFVVGRVWVDWWGGVIVVVIGILVVVVVVGETGKG